jgi:hypothetical protein
MLRLPALLVLLLMGQEDRPTLTHVLIASHVVLQTIDATETTYLLGAGGFKEANPLIRPFAGSPWRLGAAKSLYAVGTSALAWHYHATHPRIVRWSLVILNTGSALVVAHNQRLINRRSK